MERAQERKEKAPQRGRRPCVVVQASAELEDGVTDWHQPKRKNGRRENKRCQRKWHKQKEKGNRGVLEDIKQEMERMEDPAGI
jgi:hypothetical protein